MAKPKHADKPKNKAFSELAKQNQNQNTKLFVFLANLVFMNYTKYVIYDY